MRVRQQQQSADAKIRELTARLENTETKQQTMINMFTAALKNPALFQRMLARSVALCTVYSVATQRSLRAAAEHV
jgi:hypothetical protein